MKASYLESYVYSDIFPAKQFAWEELGQTGALGLRKYIGCWTTTLSLRMPPRAYVTASGEAGEDLNERLGEQVKFRLATGSLLSSAWRNRQDTAVV